MEASGLSQVSKRKKCQNKGIVSHYIWWVFSFLIIPIIRKHDLVTQNFSIMQGPRDSEELQ